MNKFFFILSILSFGALAENQACLNHFNSYSELHQKDNIFKAYNDDRFIAKCNKKNIIQEYNDYDKNLNIYDDILKNTKLIFNNYDHRFNYKSDFVNTLLFKNKRKIISNLEFNFSKNTIYLDNKISETKNNKLRLPQNILISKIKSVTLNCNNFNDKKWFLNDELKNYKFKHIEIKNCNLGNVENLYNIYANKISIINSITDKPISTSRFKFTKNIKLKNISVSK